MQVHTLGQISQVLEFTAGLTFLDEILKYRNTDALNGTQPKTDAGLAHHIKFDVAAIDIRRQNLEFHTSTFRQVPDDFIRLVQVARHDGGHVLFRKVCLQVRRLITNQAVSSRVGFVESVFGELGHQIKNAVGFGKINAVGRSPGNETGFLRCHFFRIFFTHGAAQQIGFAKTVTRQSRSRVLDLFLIKDDPVGFLQNGFKLRQRIINALATVLSFDEIVDHT